jgi:hypothetical protein
VKRKGWYKRSAAANSAKWQGVASREIGAMVQRKATAAANIQAGIGVIGIVLTVFAHSHPPLSLSNRLKSVIVDWQDATRGFWGLTASWFGADLSSNLEDGLTLSAFLIVAASAVKDGLPFQERRPRLLSLSLEYFALYLLLTALFVALPFDRHSDQFDLASMVQFFLLLPVFAFCAASTKRPGLLKAAGAQVRLR